MEDGKKKEKRRRGYAQKEKFGERKWTKMEKGGKGLKMRANEGGHRFSFWHLLLG